MFAGTLAQAAGSVHRTSQRHQARHRRRLSRYTPDMDLPTSREIELETLLRQRDAQVQDLTVRTIRMALAIGGVSHERALNRTK